MTPAWLDGHRVFSRPPPPARPFPDYGRRLCLRFSVKEILATAEAAVIIVIVLQQLAVATGAARWNSCWLVLNNRSPTRGCTVSIRIRGREAL